ncbi:MAG: mechanosensitive ion channel family protein [Microcystaceae cyanobacterium]
MTQFLKQTLKLIIIAGLSLILNLSWTPQLLSQIPFFPTASAESSTLSTNHWDLNKAYNCGRYWCSDVYIFDGEREASVLLTPELTLAITPNAEQPTLETKQLIEERAKVVERIFNKIIDDISKRQTKLTPDSPSPVPEDADWRFWIPKQTTPPHPLTPIVDVGFKNGQTVVYVPEQPELGLAAQDIVTVTRIDATVSGTTVEDLANEWRLNIRNAFNQAFWGREMDIQHPRWRWTIVFLVIGVVLVLLVLSYYLYDFLRKRNNQLGRKLNELTEVMAADSETSVVQHSPLNAQTDELILENNQDLSPQQQQETTTPPSLSPDSQNGKSRFLKRFVRNTIDFAAQSAISPASFLLKRQTLINQQRNICQLLIRLVFVLDILVVAMGMVAIVFTFRQTRFLSSSLFQETINLIILWTALILIDKIGDFIVDFLLNRWAREGQKNDPTSNRYGLRVDTYSKTAKSATTFIAIFIGGYATIWILGINPAVLASAGVFAVAVAFLSRSLLEDLLNGLLILVNDRYVIGDVINVGGDLGGGVEDINLFTTSLRNIDGHLISIPNRKIESVTNFSKNWSQVNFTIKIAWNENVDRAISVMNQVAEEMQSEPQWAEKCLQPAEVLGVDDISYEGILLRMILKTLPKEQWGVGREYRRRLKLAFEKENIALGIPYHQVTMVSPRSDEFMTMNYQSSEDGVSN